MLSCSADPPLESVETGGPGRADGGVKPAPAQAPWTALFETPADFFCVGTRCEAGIGMDLGFNPVRAGELWAVFRQTYDGAPCEGSGGDNSGCQSLNSLVGVISNVVDAELEPAPPSAMDVAIQDDGNSWHFMRLATALAFAADDAFATVGEARTGNFTDDAPDFMGPTLWSSNPDIFGKDFGLNGSHLDMLHATPYGMGIAHERDHVFWAFNGQVGAIDRYDFVASHEPGGADHTDGLFSRYVTGSVRRVVDVPSHLEFLPDRRTLLIADSGNGRVLALDTASGTRGAKISVDDDQIADPFEVDGAQLTELVAPGTVEVPSGLAVRGERFVVGDAATGVIHRFEADGTPVDRFDTELGPGQLTGLEFGPDGVLYGMRRTPGTVLRFSWP